MKSNVIIAGIGQTPVGEHWDLSLRELALMAVEAVNADAVGLQPQALYIGNMLASQLSRQAHLGALVADFTGMVGIEALTLDAAGASGGAALRMGYLAVTSGEVDVALVLGVEKSTDQIGTTFEEAVSTASDSDYEAVHGMTQSAQAAMLMRRYLYEFEAPRSAFGAFPLAAHANGVSNEYAMFRKAIKPQAYENAGIVSDPLNMYDLSPFADGAAALLLTREELLPPGYPQPLVRIAGSSLVTDALALHDRIDPLTFSAARKSVDRARKAAGITNDQIDLFELYDAFSIYTVLSLEAADYAARGQGWRLAEDGKINLGGELPICTFGGLKARGNPGGATGIYQVVEAVMQLRGQAGDNQVPDAARALVQSLGGPASTAVTHVLERVDS